MKNTDASANMTLDKRATKMLHSIIAQGKVETPKLVEKPKFKAAVHPQRAAKPGEARELSTSDGFVTRCQKHDIPATRRQAAKYLQKRGRLWNVEHGK